MALHTQQGARLQVLPSPYGDILLRSSQLCWAALIGSFIKKKKIKNSLLQQITLMSSSQGVLMQ